MTVTFSEKLARIPHYEPGTSLDDAFVRLVGGERASGSDLGWLGTSSG